MAPAMRTHELQMRKVICLSTGDLQSDLYGDEGNAGGSVGEDDGGSLF